ncbi:hypothetical protein MES4922_210111 [Mesorhizobium ventifaucium]|uniref:Uncharacterized protein n=1 Tax=Mesorhizobium ventifaucium TaxID=666020 RepID=A0ABM9DR32_9HYPH|nr:hypothetical protein MES4922_210111 [Mesorhizobium ventifaucium]
MIVDHVGADDVSFCATEIAEEIVEAWDNGGCAHGAAPSRWSFSAAAAASSAALAQAGQRSAKSRRSLPP